MTRYPGYFASRIGNQLWAVATPDGAAENILEGPDAETRVRALVAERNAELDEDTRFSLADAILAEVSCQVAGYPAGDAIATAEYLLERFTITPKPAQ